MSKNFYAVYRGKNPGIYTSWEQCKRQVKGYPNPIFKGFKYKGDAEDFIHYVGAKQEQKFKKAHQHKLASSDFGKALRKAHYVLYTDGGYRKSQNVGAWAYRIDDRLSNHEKVLVGSKAYQNVTNNQMELTAMIQGLAKLLVVNHNPILVVSDSEYVLNGITCWIKRWEKNGFMTEKRSPVKNQGLWEKLDFFKNQFDHLNFIWEKGHHKCEGNNWVDQRLNDEMDTFVNKYIG